MVLGLDGGVAGGGVLAEDGVLHVVAEADEGVAEGVVERVEGGLEVRGGEVHFGAELLDADEGGFAVGQDVVERGLDGGGEVVDRRGVLGVVRGVLLFGARDKVVEVFHLHVEVLHLLVDYADRLGVDGLGRGLDGAAVLVGGLGGSAG